MAESDKSLVQTQTNVTLDFSETAKLLARPIVFEMDDLPDSEQATGGFVRIRKYPADNNAIPGSQQFADTLNYQVTQGEIFFTNEVRNRDVFGRLQFTGSERVRLPYPVVSNFAMFKVGRYYDVYGNLCNPVFVLDQFAGEIVSSIPCYGVVDYGYVTNYRILRYRPELFLGDEMQAVWNSQSYGQLIATFRISFTLPINTPFDPLPAITFQIQPPESLNVEVELYRIESTIIVNQDGAWEKPTGWPDTGTFTGVDPTLEIDVNAPYLQVPRVHEIAHMSLQDFDSRHQNSQSKYYLNLPLSFKKQEKDKDVSGRALISPVMSYFERVEPRPQEYWDRVRDFRIPRMRVSRFEQKLQKPFDERKYVTGSRFVIYQSPIGATILPGEYQVRLDVVKGRPPFSAGDTRRSLDTRNVSTADYQATLTNSALYRAWRSIDWAAIKSIIKAGYPETWFRVEFPDDWLTS